MGGTKFTVFLGPVILSGDKLVSIEIHEKVKLVS